MKNDYVLESLRLIIIFQNHLFQRDCLQITIKIAGVIIDAEVKLDQLLMLVNYFTISKVIWGKNLRNDLTGRGRVRRAGPYDRVLADSALTTGKFFENMFEAQTKQTVALEKTAAQYKRLADATEERVKVERERNKILGVLSQCVRAFVEKSFPDLDMD